MMVTGFFVLCSVCSCVYEHIFLLIIFSDTHIYISNDHQMSRDFEGKQMHVVQINKLLH